jgi:hypothetical protein
MKNFFKKYKYLILTIIVSFLIYLPSLFGFYTNDDFYHLRISHATNFTEFLNFFNLEKSAGGQLLYRPLTTHVFYFLGWSLFNLNPVGLHIVSFLMFFITVVCVYKLALLISENEGISNISAFLYATSATHFGHLYYLATELVLAVFFFPSVIFFINYLKNSKKSQYILSVIFFVLALMAKENSVVLIPVFMLLYIYFRIIKKTKIVTKSFVFGLLPELFILIGYMYFHFFYYGFVKGDSYIWNLSPIKAANTVMWYLLWSFNIPEMFNDFFGPGIQMNPNLLKYWSNSVIPIALLFFAEMAIFSILFFKSIKSKFVLNYLLLISWFIVTLAPILFLPLHKFTFYLTLPLFGFVVFVGYMLVSKKKTTVLFCIVWVLTSIFTLNLTRSTNWITNGELIARKVFNYTQANMNLLSGKTINFYDSDEDKLLPFSPTDTLKNTLSDNNFFEVLYSGSIKATYDVYSKKEDVININSRIFLDH